MQDHIMYNNQPLHFRVQGSGPWIVLLHGFLESLEIWSEMATDLSGKFSVLMVDLPGHGRSGLESEEQTIPLMAAGVRAVMATLRIDEFILCGHSMGGYVCLEIAREMGEKTKGLILLHSHAAPDDEKAKENRNRTINIVKLNHSNFIHSFIPDLFAETNRERLAIQIDRLRNRSASTGSKAIVAALNAMRDRDGGFDVVMNASFPIFFIIGKNDTKMPYEKIMAQSMLANHAEILLLSNVGHMGMIEAPEKVFPAIRDFCKRNLYIRVPDAGFGD